MRTTTTIDPATNTGPVHTDPVTLAKPARSAGPGRNITYEWDVGDAGEGKRRVAVLRISHHTAGSSLFSGTSHPNHFSATLINEDVNGRMRSTRLFSGRSIDAEPVTRFSQKRLELFAEQTLGKLSDLYAAQDDAVLPYFQPDEA